MILRRSYSMTIALRLCVLTSNPRNSFGIVVRILLWGVGDFEQEETEGTKRIKKAGKEERTQGTKRTKNSQSFIASLNRLRSTFFCRGRRSGFPSRWRRFDGRKKACPSCR